MHVRLAEICNRARVMRFLARITGGIVHEDRVDGIDEPRELGLYHVELMNRLGTVGHIAVW